MNIKTCSTTVVAGMTESGKSHLIKYLVYDFACKNEIDYVVVFCNTSFNEGYDFVPKDFIHEGYTEEALENIMKHQQQTIESGDVKQCLVIFDDVLGDISFNSFVWTSFISKLRHYKITCFLATQQITKISTTTRENCHYACLFTPYTKNSRQAYYESYGGRFGSEKEFLEYVDNGTKDYGFIFYSPRGGKTTEEMYKCCRAPANLPKFRLEFDNNDDEVNE